MTRTTAGLLVVFLWTLLGPVPAGAQVHPGPFDPGCAASTGFAIDLISASKYRGPIYNENACRDARGRRLGYIPLVLLKQRELRIQASSTRAAAEPLLLDGKGRLIAQARRDTVLVYRAAPGIYYAGARMLGPGVGTGTLQLAI